MKFSKFSRTIAPATLFAVASSSAAPIDFPESLVYEENFDTLDPFDNDFIAPLGEEWSFIITDNSVDPPFVDVFESDSESGWLQTFVADFTPTEVLDEAAFPTNASAADGLNDGAGPGYGTLEPITPPQFLNDLGFSGGWLINEGLGDFSATDVNGDQSVFEMLLSATARIEFENLPEHVGIDIDFITAAGDSIDRVDDRNDRDGPFEIRVDGETVLSQFGGSYPAPAGVGVLATSANILGTYEEMWIPDPPSSLTDREALSWRLDSAYDYSTSLALSSIEHTAETLTIDFIHRLGSDPTDEYTALDNVRITLLTEAFVPNNQWPGGTTFFEDFDEPLDPNFWTLDGWATSEVFEGGTPLLTGNRDSLAGVRNSPPTDPDDPDDLGDFFPADFPIEPLVPAQSLNDLDPGFSGNWLISNLGPGNTTLSFRGLPPHTAVRMGFKLAGGNSVDEDDRFVDDNLDDDLFLDEANLAILVDGEFRFLTLVQGSGIGLIEPLETEDGEFFDDITIEDELAINANLGGFYREQWFQDPQSEDDRQSLAWVLDSAYDLTAVPQLQEIEHTADAISIEFLHALDGDSFDEFIALDSFEFELIGTGILPPEPLLITGVDGSGLPDQVGITFGSTDGMLYDVERSTDLTGFAVVSPAVGVAATGQSTTFVDTAVPAGAERVFYRVRERAPLAE